MTAYEQVLRNAVGFFYAADTVTRAEWSSYVQTLRLQQYYPGIQGLGFTIRLSPEEVAPFTRKIRAEGYPSFQVWPEGRREEYHSIIYLESFTGRNLRAFGYDMYTKQKRRKAMQRARDTGDPALSEMVILVQETGKDVQKGCFLTSRKEAKKHKTALMKAWKKQFRPVHWNCNGPMKTWSVLPMWPATT